MSSPFSGAELRELIAKLERLEKWHQDLEGPPSGQPPAKGYTRGDPKTRAAACGPLSEKPGFPAIPPVARLWKCVKEEGAAVAASEFGSIEEGPGPVPDHLQRQAAFVCLGIQPTACVGLLWHFLLDSGLGGQLKPSQTSFRSQKFPLRPSILWCCVPVDSEDT